MTRYLATSAREVVAVELDQHLLPPLKAVLAPYQNVRLIQGDILELSPDDLIQGQDYVVAANVPYYITSAVIRHLLESRHKPRRVVLTIQKEVARRICEKPGDMSLMALSVQVYGRPRVAAQVPAGAFFPAPSVDSAVLVIDIYPEPLIPPEDLESFFQIDQSRLRPETKDSSQFNILRPGIPGHEIVIPVGVA